MIESVTRARTAVLNLAPAFLGKPRIASIVYALAQEAQALEAAAFQLLTLRSVDTATGAALTVLGRIVGENRRERTDERFRIAIRGRILANRSLGRWSTLLRLLALVRPGETYQWFEGPASILVEANTDDHDLNREVLTLLRAARAAGVDLQMTAPATDATEFELSPNVDGADSDTLGFSSTTETALGGELRTIL